mmetsp:Transcript_39143/g.54593  ORF Transcript_39143/g.54593 Transcript_39143/m.54593 type:complete len:130 (-) Transcript_39143:46-435(-)
MESNSLIPTQIKSGRPYFPSEITERTPLFLSLGTNQSVRVIGRLIGCDIHEDTASLEDEGALLVVDLRFISSNRPQVGSLVMVIGETFEKQVGEKKQFIVTARIWKCVDGMDMGLYRHSITLCRHYLPS